MSQAVPHELDRFKSQAAVRRTGAGAVQKPAAGQQRKSKTAACEHGTSR